VPTACSACSSPSGLGAGSSHSETSVPKIRYLTHAEARRLVNAYDAVFRPLVQ
jgi:hypothetical protein